MKQKYKKLLKFILSIPARKAKHFQKGQVLIPVLFLVGAFSVILVTYFDIIQSTFREVQKAKQGVEKDELFSQLTALFSNPIRCQGAILADDVPTPPTRLTFGAVPATAVNVGATLIFAIDLGADEFNARIKIKTGQTYKGVTIGRMTLTENDFRMRVVFPTYTIYWATVNIETSKAETADNSKVTVKRLTLPVFLNVESTTGQITSCNSAIGSLWSDDGFGNVFRNGGKVGVGLTEAAMDPTIAGSVTGSFNVGFNFRINGATATTGVDNLAIGKQSMYDETLAKSNLTTGSRNVAVGNGTLIGNSTGNDNTAFGSSALWEDRKGSDNSVAGASAGTHFGNNDTFSFPPPPPIPAIPNPNPPWGAANTALGYLALGHIDRPPTSVKISSRNGAMGMHADVSNYNGADNNSIGAFARSQSSDGAGQFNNSVGALALNSDTGLVTDVGGNGNTGVGRYAGYHLTTGSYNTSIGANAGADNTTGSNNVAVGINAHPGQAPPPPATTTTAASNPFVGYGFDNTISIGPAAQHGASNSIQIGQGFGGAVNSFSIGGDGAPVYIQTVLGGVTPLQFDPTTCEVSMVLSDRRLKTDIRPIVSPLEKIRSLQGYKFKFKSEVNSQIDVANDRYHLGLIAQEVQDVLPEIVGTGPDVDKLKSVSYSALVPILIEGLKAQQVRLNHQKKTLAQLRVLACQSVARPKSPTEKVSPACLEGLNK